MENYIINPLEVKDLDENVDINNHAKEYHTNDLKKEENITEVVDFESIFGDNRGFDVSKDDLMSVKQFTQMVETSSSDDIDLL